ncbi:hypothetical protein L249_2602 [Ophiocordyceps polyrhachis-furcata BCC 54312]|uniref:Uncharacterized protein n=1 Tax=Ophiocordyceps polyrhachis-furcata BCC 54312 TaxID=1330021 RepID=A0A367LPS1_9HYPO|nr:hypothetical protein L249_2602 [Ophiocordyceps polyrhachis-furcata BCC 54312]
MTGFPLSFVGAASNSPAVLDQGSGGGPWSSIQFNTRTSHHGFQLPFCAGYMKFRRRSCITIVKA